MNHSKRSGNEVIKALMQLKNGLPVPELPRQPGVGLAALSTSYGGQGNAAATSLLRGVTKP